MYITSKDEIFTYVKLLNHCPGGRVLDLGMFLNRIGAVSRNVADLQIPEDLEIDGLMTYPQIKTGIYDTIYDHIYTADEVFSPTLNKSYDLCIGMSLSDNPKILPIIPLAISISKYTFLERDCFKKARDRITYKVNTSSIISAHKTYEMINVAG